MCVAQLCRSICGLTFVPAAPRTISQTHCRVSAFPRTLKNKARVITLPAFTHSGRPIAKYLSSASIAERPSGTILSLSPFPRTCARPWSRCKSSTRSEQISPTLNPPPHTAPPKSHAPAAPAHPHPPLEQPHPSAPASPPLRPQPATSAAPSSSTASPHSPWDHAQSAYPSAAIDKTHVDNSASAQSIE